MYQFPFSAIPVSDSFVAADGSRWWKASYETACKYGETAPVRWADDALVSLVHYVPAKGGRVVTPQHGAGTVIGFETFARGGGASLSDDFLPRRRVCVRLDNPGLWSLSAPGVHPFYTARELKPE